MCVMLTALGKFTFYRCAVKYLEFKLEVIDDSLFIIQTKKNPQDLRQTEMNLSKIQH